MEQIPGVDQLLVIKGIGRGTIAGFLAEIGDIGNYLHPKQIVSLQEIQLVAVRSNVWQP
ncbi:transposase [Paenibacillus sp.]|uniref:transposase n=1 Tax=Paenibacillus sp. TaxID=58172 RepID=UPI0037C930D7